MSAKYQTGTYYNKCPSFLRTIAPTYLLVTGRGILGTGIFLRIGILLISIVDLVTIPLK